MDYTQLGRTGVQVSRLGFGGAPAGLTNYLDPYSPDNADQRETVLAALQKALDLGITYFDTAPGYGQGASELIFGEGLAEAGESVFLATKLSLSAESVVAAVETSLRRLRRERLDLIQLHGDSYRPELVAQVLRAGGVLDQLAQLRAEGLLRFIGFTSEDNNPAVYQFIESGRFDVMQVCYNLLFQHPAEFSRPFGSMFEAEAQQMGICTMRAMTSGLFQKWVQMVNPDNQFDYTPALLQFVLSNPLVDVALVGMRTSAEVEANVQIWHDLAGRMDMHTWHAKYVS